MTKAETIAGVHTHTHTDIFKKINKGRNTFICDIKMTDYR